MSQLTIPVQYFRMGLNHARDSAERAAMGKNPGPWLLDHAAIDSMMTVFAGWGKPLNVDFEHASISGSAPGSAPERYISAGRVLEMKPVTDHPDPKMNGMWGTTRYTEQASQFIREDKMNWTSPVFNVNAKDQNRIVRMTGAALTNDPAICLNEIRASMKARGDFDEPEMLDFLKINLQLAEAINFGAGPFSAGALTMSFPKLAKMLGLPETATEAEIEAKAESIFTTFSTMKAEIASVVGMKADESIGAIAAKAKSLITAAANIPAGQELNSAAADKINALTAQLASFQVKFAQRDAIDAVRAHMTGAVKRISPAEYDSFVELATSNRTLFDALMKTKDPIVTNLSPTNGKGVIASVDSQARGVEMAKAAARLVGLPLVGAAS